MSARVPSLGSEERFRLLVESIRDYAIFLLDVDGRVASWNLGAERIHGYRGDEIIGQHFSRFYPEEDIRAGRPHVEIETATREGRFEDEGWRVRKGGTRFWANVVLTALREADGTLVGFAKVTRDLTERRHAEQQRIALAQAEEASRVKDAFLEREQAARRAAEEARTSLATALRSIGDAVIATDADGKITLMNAVAESLVGWPVEEAVGRPLAEVFSLVDEATRAAVSAPIADVLREGVVFGLAEGATLIARDGTETPIADSAAPIRDDSGEVRGVIFVFRDVSEERRSATQRAFLADATAALTSSLDYRETLARVTRLAVPRLADWCAIDLMDAPGAPIVRVAVAHVDPAKVHMAEEIERRYPPDPNATTGVPEVVRSGRSQFYPEIPDELLVQAATDEEHLRLARELGLRSAITVPLVAGRRVFGALTLVHAESERRYTEDDLAFAEEVGRRAGTAIENARLYAAEQRAREAADAANRSKDEFLASVSHELRTPLNAILGWSRLLGGALPEEKRQRAVTTIERNAVAMAQLVDDLLDVSRIVSGKLRLEVGSVDLALVMEAALDSIKPAAEARNIHVDSSIDPAAARILGDAARLQQVVWNLLSNAVKFTPPGGHVAVSLQRVDSGVEIRVRDDGRGINPDFLPHVFEAFRQADGSMTRQARGLGLGLAICHHLVELHGGRIEARSEGDGKGATFVVWLPVPASRSVPPLVAEAAPPPDESGGPKLGGVRVLVVEDEPDAREVVCMVLEQQGAVVLSAANADDALALLERELPDVLLSDIGLPGQDGYELVRRVRALPPERGGRIPAAALTAFARSEDRRTALSAGFMLHVAKPVEPAELVSVVAALARYAPPRERK